MLGLLADSIVTCFMCYNQFALLLLLLFNDPQVDILLHLESYWLFRSQSVTNDEHLQ